MAITIYKTANPARTFFPLFLLFLSLLFAGRIIAQVDSSGQFNQDAVSTGLANFPDTSSTTEIFLTQEQRRKRSWLIGSLNVVGYSTALIMLNEAWYKNEPRQSFHVFDDSKEWLQVDKVGHSWTAYNASRAATAMWQWTGVDSRKAAWIGSLSSLVYMTGIEYLDAHSAKWGWSWSDMAANLAGSGLFLGQQLAWNEQRIQFKFSFHRNSYEPMLEQRADQLYGKSFAERMLKDYNAQTYWLSLNLKSFLPDSGLPAWLNIAAGYGASGMFGGFENKWTDANGIEISRYDIKRVRQYYLAPDIDLTKIPTKSRFLKTTFSILNSFKFPAPALQLDSKGKFEFVFIAF